MNSSRVSPLVRKAEKNEDSSSDLPVDSSHNHLMELNDNKAGMHGLDKEKINQIIEAASKGSKFYEHKKKQQARVDAKATELLEKRRNLTVEQIRVATEKVDAIVKRLEKSRDVTKTIVHVDMDAFFAAVEMRENPSLKDKPMAVGGEGMLSTSNYLARRFGVRAAMPGFIARKLCPQLIIVPTNFKKYGQVSSIVGSVFERYDPNYTSMSLDEAYLDLTEFLSNDHNLRLPDDSKSHAEKVVEELRAEIFAETDLTASAGIAPNTFLAKVCSDMNKPNGQYYLKPDVETVREFVRVLPVRKAFGIGKVTEAHLSALGIVTCEDMFNQRGLLSLLFTETSAMSFLRISMGLGSTSLGSDEPAKSVSNEGTFRDNNNPEFLRNKCKVLCEELSKDLKRKKMTAETVTLKLKTDKFDVKTRAKRMRDYTDDGEVFWRFVRPLLEAEMGNGTVSFRLMGVRASTLKENDEVVSGAQTQMTLDKMLKSTKPTAIEKTCPVCSASLKGKTPSEINSHVDSCLSEPSELPENIQDCLEAKREQTSDLINCPVCNLDFSEKEIQAHVELCLIGGVGPSSSFNRVAPSVPTEAQKKRKNPVRSGSGVLKKSRKAVGTLDAYFKKR